MVEQTISLTKQTQAENNFQLIQVIERYRDVHIVTYEEALEFVNNQPNEQKAFVNFLYIGTTDIEWSMKLHNVDDNRWYFDIPLFEDGEFKFRVFTSMTTKDSIEKMLLAYFSKGEYFYYYQNCMINDILRYCSSRWKIEFTDYDLNPQKSAM